MSGGIGRRRESRLPRKLAWLALALALGLTLLDAAKPLVIDDGAFYQNARQIVRDPADPYGFELHWFAEPVPAVEIYAPPVVPYWWAAAMRIFGDRPLLWKLWLFPFALLLAGCCARLLRRVAPGDEAPLLCIALLSPAILPALNLMLDLPALALALASMVLVIEACDATRWRALAAAAGLVAGLALQTKYTAVLPFAACVLYAARVGRSGVAFTAGASSTLVFVAWEAYTAHRYGTSHFLLATALQPRFALGSVAQRAAALFCLLGASSPVIALLALRHRPLLGAAFALAATLAFAAIALLPPGQVASIGPVFPPLEPPAAEAWMPALLGLAVLAAASWSAARLLFPPARERSSPLEQMLVGWLGLELVGFFLMAPYPAMRRVVGLHLALTLVVGCAAARVPQAGRAGLRAAAGWGAALGLLFAVSDLADARARRQGVRDLVARIESEDASGDVGSRWFVGHWGFFYYADRAGLQPVAIGRSRLEPGDWLAVPFGVHRQPIRPPPGSLQEVAVIAAQSAWPWSTIPSAYSGHRPIRPQPDAQLRILLYRVRAPFTASAR